jgi:flagellar motor switch protein FliN/FliY
MAEDNLTLDEFGGAMLASEMPVELTEKTASDLAPVFDVPVNISAVLGRAHMSVAQLLQLGQGSILELDRKVGEAIDIYVNNRLVARGEVVVVDERLGVTMTEIIKDGDQADARWSFERRVRDAASGRRKTERAALGRREDGDERGREGLASKRRSRRPTRCGRGRALTS